MTTRFKLLLAFIALCLSCAFLFAPPVMDYLRPNNFEVQKPEKKKRSQNDDDDFVPGWSWGRKKVLERHL